MLMAALAEITISTWQRKGLSTVADLVIQQNAKNKKLYKLFWRRATECSFEGDGMLCDMTLIGDYREVASGYVPSWIAAW